ncbi:MAG: hypothetical protein J1E63_10455 [Muribaculaceae bacterium]|nr:hypothetical protein [Muribaculaceae bacterium]
MKRLFYSLLILPLIALAACSEDDNVPQVTFDVAFEGATNVDGTFYVVQGDSLMVNAVTVTPVAGTKDASVGNVTYIWDYQPAGTMFVAPFGVAIPTSRQSLGEHLLQLDVTVLQVDKAVGTAILTYPVMIVKDVDEIPQGANVNVTALTGITAPIREATGV